MGEDIKIGSSHVLNACQSVALVLAVHTRSWKCRRCWQELWRHDPHRGAYSELHMPASILTWPRALIQFFKLILWGSGTPLINWRPNWHRICRRKCVKWSDMKWNLGISDLGEIPKRRAPKNDADWRIRFVQNSHGEPIGDTNDKRLIKQY